MHQQQRGIITQAAGLMVEHGADQAPQQLIGGLAAGGFTLQQVHEPVQPEQLPVSGAGLGHPVGVQQHGVIRLQAHRARAGNTITEPERQRGVELSSATTLRPRSSSGGGCPAHDHSSCPDPVASRPTMPVANDKSS